MKKEIKIKEETANFLVNYFKKYEGKYIYFKFEWGDDKTERINIWFIEKVSLRNEEAKIKLGKFDNEKRIIEKARWSLIRTLKNNWLVVDKEEIEKMLVMNKLK